MGKTGVAGSAVAGSDVDSSGDVIVPLSARWARVPRFVWFVVSGGLGDVAMFALSRCVSTPIGDVASRHGVDPDAAAWLVCFAASVSWRHVLHALIVFGGRWSTLLRDMAGTYSGYVAGIAFSTLLRYAVARSGHLEGDAAFFAVLYTTALFNFAVLSAIQQCAQQERRKDGRPKAE